MKKLLLLFIFSFLIFNNNFAANYETEQALKLNNLFTKLSKNKDYKEADTLEKKIWAIWNKHPNNQKLNQMNLSMSVAVQINGKCFFE